MSEINMCEEFAKNHPHRFEAIDIPGVPKGCGFFQSSPQLVLDFLKEYRHLVALKPDNHVQLSDVPILTEQGASYEKELEKAKDRILVHYRNLPDYARFKD